MDKNTGGPQEARGGNIITNLKGNVMIVFWGSFMFGAAILTPGITLWTKTLLVMATAGLILESRQDI